MRLILGVCVCVCVCVTETALENLDTGHAVYFQLLLRSQETGQEMPLDSTSLGLRGSCPCRQAPCGSIPGAPTTPSLADK